MAGLFDYEDTNVSRAVSIRDQFTERNRVFRDTKLYSCQFVVTGGYQDQVRRPFEVSADSEDIERLYEATMRGRNTSSASLSSVAGNIMKPSVEIEDYVPIEQGWAAPRTRFVLEFRRESIGGINTRYIYAGFTDYVGIDLNGNIDPDMELHLTTSIVLRETASMYRGVPQIRTSLISFDQIMRGDTGYLRGSADQYPDIERTQYRMTPYDVFTSVATRSGIDEVDDIEVFPMNSSLGRKPVKSRRTNLLPSTYLSTVMSSARAALNNSIDLHSAGESDAYQESIRQASENRIGEDPLFSIFGKDTDIFRTSVLVWEDLAKVFPEAENDNVTMVSFPSELQHLSNRNFSSTLERYMDDEADSTNSWNNYSQTTMIATSVVQQLPTIMMVNLIRDIRFTVTNEVVNGLENPFEWFIGDRRARDNSNAVKFIVDGLPEDLEMELFRSFQMKFEQIILFPLTNFNNIDISLMVDARADGDVFLSVSFAGSEPVEYRMATFADSHSASIITHKRDHYQNVTNDLYQLAQHVLSF